ncbi:MAG TPA: hypothetical protein VF380_03890 [Solirubrobacteraceae bacterium]
MNAQPAPDTDTAMVLGIASTALPFARSPEAEAERWLRILRMHGDAGTALQSLGVSEAPLEAAALSGGTNAPAQQAAPAERRDVVAMVSENAARVATFRGAGSVGAGDVLVAVMHVYGGDFDRVLRSHGTDRDEVLERLGIPMLVEADA